MTIPAGGPSPLDLGAIEARLRLPQVQQHAAPVGAWHDAQALLSLLRETRAALRDARWDAGSGSPCWCDAALDSQELHSMRCREIAAVLGAAQDVEALRAEADEYYRKLLQLLPLRSKQEAARLGLGAPP